MGFVFLFWSVRGEKVKLREYYALHWLVKPV